MYLNLGMNEVIGLDHLKLVNHITFKTIHQFDDSSGISIILRYMLMAFRENHDLLNDFNKIS